MLVFDFDGTLADTLDAIVEICNRLAPEFGVRPVTAREISHLQNLSVEQIIQYSDVPLIKLLRLLRRVKQELQAEIPQLQLIPQMAETLERLAASGQSMGIVTSNSAENVEAFLQVHGLESRFEFVQSGVSLFGKSRVLKKMLKLRGLDPEQVIYVGDETRDVDASRRVKMPVAAVTWGFNSRQALIRHQPDFLLDRPEDLIPIARSLRVPTN